MDVTCERCATEYEFDETLLSARGTSVKCTNCGHVFKVYPRAREDADRSTSTWRLQRRDGTVDTLESLRELQRRIASGELTPHDEIARGDEGWKPLGSIPELETFFQAAEAQAPTAPSPSPYPPPAASASDSDAPEGRTPSSQPPRRRPRQPTLLGVVPVPKPGVNPGPARPQPSPGEPPAEAMSTPTRDAAASTNGSVPPSSAVPTDDASASDDSVRLPEQSDPPGVVVVPADESLRLPEPTEDPQPIRAVAGNTDDHEIADAEFEEPKRARGRSTPPPSYFDDDEDIPELPGRGWSPTRWLLIVTVAVAIGVVGANFDQFLALIGFGPSTEAADNALGDGDAALREDQLASYERAVQFYGGALEQDGEDPTVFARLSNAHALAAQAIADGSKPSPGQMSQRDHASAALNYAEQSLMLDPESLAARLAEADALRLSGETQRARKSLERSRLMPFSRTAEFYRIDALLTAEEHGGDLERGLESARQAAEASPDGIRYRLLRARVGLAVGDLSGVQEEVDAVYALAPRHPDARALEAALEARRANPKEQAAKEPEPAEPEAAATEAEPAEDAEEPAPAPKEAPPELTAEPAPAATPSPAAADAETPPEKPKSEPRAAAPAKKPRASAARPRKRPEYDEYDRLAEAAGSDAFIDGRPPVRDFGWYMREGEASLAGGDYSKARAYFESALEARPGSGDATDALGRVEYASGDYELAVRYFRSAAQRGHPDGYYSLGEAYERLERGNEAVSAYYTYLKRRPTGRHVAEARAAIKRIEPRVKLPDEQEPNPNALPSPAPEANTP